MNIKSALKNNRSKETCRAIVDYIGQDEERCKELLDLIVGDNPLYSQKASWVLHFITDESPYLFRNFNSSFLRKLQEKKLHDAVKRGIVRAWAEAGFPDELEGEIYNHCLAYINSNEAIAIKVHAMAACLRVVKRHPELLREFTIIIEEALLRYGENSAAIRSRVKNTLKELKKIS